MPSGNDAGETFAGRAAPLVAVVVTHNRCAQLAVTLARLLETPETALRAIVVVDNASSDGTGEVLARLSGTAPKRIHIERSAANLGGAGGFERGMRRAAELFDPDWIVVMDDDARPSRGALEAFLASNTAGWDAIAAAVYFPAGDICEMNRPSRNPFRSLRAMFKLLVHALTGKGRDGFHIPKSAYGDTKKVPIDATSFVGLFLSRDAMKRAGLPDPKLFIYGDDVLYTLALSEAGGRIAFDPLIRFEHDFSTLPAKEQRFTPLWKSYYHHRNLLLVYRKAAGAFFWPALLYVLPKWLLKVRHHGGDRRAYLRLLTRAVRDGLTGRLGATLDEIKALAA